MSDFETLVSSLLRNGAKPDELQETITKISKTNSEASEREKLLTQLKSAFCGPSSYKNAAWVSAYMAANLNPEWKKKEILEYAETMENNLKLCASLIGKEPLDAIGIILKELGKD